MLYNTFCVKKCCKDTKEFQIFIKKSFRDCSKGLFIFVFKKLVDNELTNCIVGIVN